MQWIVGNMEVLNSAILYKSKNTSCKTINRFHALRWGNTISMLGELLNPFR